MKLRNKSRKKQRPPTRGRQVADQVLDQLNHELTKARLIAVSWTLLTVDLPDAELAAANAVRTGEATPEQRAMFQAVRARRQR
ncbi:MAG: hypothetical protein L0332_34580 [Chloroflexi bacterium]|nr:hypothetical protein [Chloroflexota bacterium]